MSQLAHIAVVVFGKEVGHRLLPVAPHSLGRLLALNRLSCQCGKPRDEVVASPFLKFLGHPLRPLLSSCLIAVDFQPLEGGSCRIACQVQEQGGVAFPVAEYGFTAHLVALESHSSSWCRRVVGAAIGGVPESVDVPGSFRQRTDDGVGQYHDRFECRHFRMRNGHGGDVAVIMIVVVGFGALERYGFHSGLNADDGVAPCQSLHRIFRCDRRKCTR